MLYERNSMYVDWCCNSYICKLCSTRKIPGKIYLRILSSVCNNLYNIKDDSIIIFSRSNGFTNGGTIEAFKYVPWKLSELVQYTKSEIKELIKDF